MHRPTFALVVLVLLAPAGAALLPPLTAQAAYLDDATVQSDGTLLAHLHGTGPGAELSGFHLQASHLEVWSYEDQGVEAGRTSGGYLLDTARAAGANDPTVTSYSDADAEAMAWGSDFLANVFSAVPFTLRVEGLDADARTIRDPVLTRTGISRDLAQAESTGDPSFSTVRHTGDHVRSTLSGQSAQFTFRGDFVLELNGVDLDIEGALHQGRDTREDLTGLSGADDQVHRDTERLLRIYVTGGVLKVGIGSDDTVAEWVQQEVEVRSQNRIGLVGARPTSGDGAAPTSIDGPVRVLLSAQEERVAVVGLPAEGTAPVGTTFAVPSDVSILVLFTLLAAVSAASAIAIAVRSVRLVPAMDDVEAALEGGSFRRAARLAGRILRSRPHLQDAMLSRAIALSRLGRHDQLVREVQRFLARDRATDGTLHYVLGLAYMDLGRSKDGRRLLAEAAQRTPDLAPQVASRIDMPRTVTAPAEHAYA